MDTKLTIKVPSLNQVKGEIKSQGRTYEQIIPKYLLTAKVNKENRINEFIDGVTYEILSAQEIATQNRINSLNNQRQGLETEDDRKAWDEENKRTLDNLGALKKAQETAKAKVKNEGDNANVHKLYAYNLEKGVELTIKVEHLAGLNNILEILQGADLTSGTIEALTQEQAKSLEKMKESIKKAFKPYTPQGNKIHIVDFVQYKKDENGKYILDINGKKVRETGENTIVLSKLSMKLYQGHKHNNKSGREVEKTLDATTKNGSKAIIDELAEVIIKSLEPTKKDIEKAESQEKAQEDNKSKSQGKGKAPKAPKKDQEPTDSKLVNELIKRGSLE